MYDYIIYTFSLLNYVLLDNIFTLVLLEWCWVKKRGVALWHFVTLNFVQAAFGPKNWDRRLKYCMQPLILVVYTHHEENFRLEVIDLYFDLHDFRKYGKIPLFSL